MTYKIEKKDVTKTYLRWWWTAELSNSFERMQALAFCASIGPVLKKLYKGRDEEYRQALKRHLTFFNSQAIWGSLIVGSTLAMEEQKASHGEIPEEMITGFKTGLMGPLAGMGDSLDFGMVQTIFYSFAASLAIAGSFIGPVFVVAFSILHFFLGYFFMHAGYQQGKESIKDILHSGKIKKIIQSAGFMGMFIMGALSASLVKVTTPLQFNTGGKEIVIQETLNKIVPGLLPLAAVFFIYWGLKYKKWTITKLMIIITIISLAGAFFGVL